MVESLKELNQICQKPRYREVGNWMARHIIRDAALPLTWLLLHTQITANQVTALSLVTGLLGMVCLALSGSGFFLLGVFFLQFWYLLDHVDGQIARYRKTSCLSGRFFDFVTHHIIHGTLFFSLGYYNYRMLEAEVFVLWGFAVSLSLIIFNLMSDTKAKTFFEALRPGKTYLLKGEEEREAKPELAASPWRKVYSFLHKISEIHVLMNILTGCALVDFILKPQLDFRIWLFMLYGTFTLPMALVKVSFIISRRKIDEEFQSRLREV